jgi:subfamily B ATP-binding cassette protein HlyB/CyaB
MLGFYRPNEGSIQFDGRDIHYLAANELRQNFGVVPQEAVLFSGSLYDNLVMVHHTRALRKSSRPAKPPRFMR